MGLGKEEQSGLALLLSAPGDSYKLLGSQKTPGSQQQLLDALEYVFQLSQAERASLSDGGPVYACLEPLLVHRISGPVAEADAPSTSSGAASQPAAPGRLGPTTVAIDEASMSGQMMVFGARPLTLESLGNFSSCRANACMFAGRHMYEATISTGGIVQIGFCTLRCPFTAEEGVGDATDSYAYDGRRVRKWHVKPSPYGVAWSAGDVIGCCIDLEAGTISFYRNGRSLGVAFRDVRSMRPHLAYFPAVSLSHGERCELNFGARPLDYPVPGYSPLQPPPQAEALQLGRQLMAYWSRLARAACAAAPSANSDAAASSSSRSGGCGVSPAAGMPWSDALLAASLLARHLAPLLQQQDYFIHALLVPALLELHGPAEPHQPAATRAAVRLLQLTLPPPLFARCLDALLEELARRCTIAPLQPEQFPFSSSYPYLALLATLVKLDAVRTRWLSHPEAWLLAEMVSTSVTPSTDDLRALVPHVWWPGSRDDASAERMRVSLQALSLCLGRVEEKRYELLTTLLIPPPPPSAGGAAARGAAGTAGGSSSGGNGGASTPAGAASSSAEPYVPLVQFVRHLLGKNRGCGRDLPPPGLSDQSVLVSTFFLLLRLLRPMMAADKPLASFPAAAIFARHHTAVDALEDLPRLGGILSHLVREAPLGPEDSGPIALPALQSSAAATTAVAGGSHGSGGSSSGSTSTAASADNAAQWLPPECLPKLLHYAMVFYHWRAASTLRTLLAAQQGQASSLAGLEEMERVLALVPPRMGGSGSGAGGAGGSHGGSGNVAVHIMPGGSGALMGLLGGSAMGGGSLVSAGGAGGLSALHMQQLGDARNHFQEEVANNARLAGLLRAVFFSGWRQDALTALAAYTANLLSAAAPRGRLLAYVPTCYVDLILDVMSAQRRALDLPPALLLGAPPAPTPTPSPLPAASAPAPASSSSSSPPPRSPPQPPLLLQAGMPSIISAMVGMMTDANICYPDTRESLLACISALLEAPPFMEAFEADAKLQEALLMNLFALFEHKQLWHPACNILSRLLQGAGFANGLSSSPPGQQRPPTPPPAGSLAYQRRLQQLAASPGYIDQPVLKTFTSMLCSMLNWAMTEYSVTVADLHSTIVGGPAAAAAFPGQGRQGARGGAAAAAEAAAGGAGAAPAGAGVAAAPPAGPVAPPRRRSVLEEQAQFRRAGVMLELVVSMLRLLEFVASHISPLFLAPAGSLNLTRLLELLEFVLPHFTTGADARKLQQLLGKVPGAPMLSSDPQRSSYRLERNLLVDKVDKYAVLAPLAGVLLGLWTNVKAAQGSLAGGGGGSPGVGASAACASAPASCVTTAQLVDALARFGQPECLQDLRGVAAAAKVAGGGASADASNKTEAGVGSTTSAQAAALLELLDAVAERGCALAEEQAALQRALGDGAEVPEEFFDPITTALMTDPVLLPDSHISVERATIARHLLTQATDPFSRTPLTLDMVQPNAELKARIQAWTAQHATPKQPAPAAAEQQ